MDVGIKKVWIAVLEDEVQEFANLNAHIAEYGRERELEYHLDHFSDGISLLETDFTKYDIVFLDIQVPMADGMTVAKKIRERDKDVVIIFVTNLAQYAICGYEVDALDYVLKPVKYFSMKFRLDKAMRRIKGGRDEEKLTLVVDRKTFSVRISDIWYIEASKHKTIYHTAYGDVEVWKAFSEAKQELEAYSFAQCHGSFCCNLKWVDGVDGENVILKDIATLKMSRNQKKQFMDALTLYWARLGR